MLGNSSIARRKKTPNKPHRRLLLETLEKRELLANWYAAPDGLDSNSGAIDSPWDLESALVNTVDVAPGDTIWLRGGTYRYSDRSARNHGYAFNLQGTSEAPITVRSYAGELATIDGGLHTAGTPRHVRIEGLEVIVSENFSEPRVSQQSGSAPTDLIRPWGGIYITTGHDIAIVNNIIHANTGTGIGFWGGVADGSEIYGNLIYDNGWIGPDRTHGHGIYTQNHSGDWKYIRDNILFDAYSLNIQAYGSDAAYIDRFIIDQNIAGPGHSDNRVLVGGSNAPNELRMRDNVSYGSNLQVGYSQRIGDDIIVTDNTIVQANLSFSAAHTDLTATNNLGWSPGWSKPRIDRAEVPVPAEPLVFLTPNIYDSNRANLALMAFQGQTEVAVDFASFLQTGDTYQLMDPSDFYGTPIASGTYTGAAILVSITGEFSTYVVLKQPASPNLDPTAVGDSAAVAEDSFVVIDVLSNDNDPDGNIDSSQVIVLHDPNHGSVIVNGDGTVTYMSDADYIGTDSFRYVVRDNDGGISNRAVVNLTISERGDLPTGSEIQVLCGKVDIVDGSSTIDFGYATLGDPITRTFTVRNLELDPLTFETPIVSAPGYTLVSGPASTMLQQGESTTFVLRLDANTSGTASGTISMVTNDSDENPFNFSVTGFVASAQVVDDGQTGFGLWGDGWQSGSGSGYGSDFHYSAPGAGKDAATWTFSVAPGVYQVATSWAAHANRATNAPYTVYNGSTALETVNINQELAPNDFTDQGNAWETLGTFQITGSKLTVSLSDLANEYVIADAVRIVRVGDLSMGPEVQVLCSGVDIANGSGVVDFGSAAFDKPITKTFTVKNLGFDPLTLGPLTVPGSPYTLVSGLASNTLQHNESTTFALRLDPEAGSNASGAVLLVTNDSDENPFTFSVTGSTPAAQIITIANKIIDDVEEPSVPKSEQLASAWVWAAVQEVGHGSQLNSVGQGVDNGAPRSFSVAPSQHRSLAFWMAHSNRLGVFGPSTNRVVHLSDATDGPGHTNARRTERSTMLTPEGVDELMGQFA